MRNYLKDSPDRINGWTVKFLFSQVDFHNYWLELF